MDYASLALIANGLLIGFLGAQTKLNFPARLGFYVANAVTVVGYAFFKTKGL